ncbi:MAG: ABC transporter ATP-binding protein [Pseudomonadota bacterium]
MSLLAVEGLETHFFTRAGVVKAVDGVSFTLERGEILGLVGESGSGKSVTGFSLIGLVDPPGRVVSGMVRLDGEDLTTLSEAALKDRRGRVIAMVFQDPMMTLNPVLTIGTQMRLALKAHQNLARRAADARAIALLEKVGIADPRARLKTYPHELSGGMRQRVAIAIALLHDPKILIADEPTTALDVSIQAQILSEMKRLAKAEGTALIFVSHDLATVSVLADRLAVMYAGKIVEEGPIKAVLSAPRHPYTAGLMRSLPSAAKPGARLPQIPGTAPSLADRPPGCAFAPRCAHADTLCQTEPPRTADGARAVRCHHPLAP